MEREKLAALVTAGQQGDPEALNELFNAFYNDVYYFALKTVKDEDLACDITQDTFIKVIESLSGLREPAAFVTWMKQIAYNECCRYFKKKKEVLVDEDEDGHSVFDTLVEERTEFIPDQAMDQEDFRGTILAMLDELSPEQRSAVLLYYHDELPVRQIAQIQGVSEGTVKSRLNYARKTLKASVEDYEKKNNIKLHSFGFFPFMLWLLASSQETMPAGAAAGVAGAVSAATGTAITVTSGSAAAAAATTAATTTATATTATAATATATATAAGTGAASFFASIPIAAKITAVVLAATVTIGGVATAVTREKPEPPTVPPVIETTVPTTVPVPEETTEPAVEETTEPIVETEPPLVFVPVADEDFPTLIQSGMTKDQLARFLCVVPGDYSGMLSADDVSWMTDRLVVFNYDSPIIEMHTNEDWQEVFSVEELNRVFSVLTDFRISEQTHPDRVDGDSYSTYGVSGANVSVDITSAEHNGVEIRIAYTYHWSDVAPPAESWQEDRIAILNRNANGLYQIRKIGRAEDIKMIDQLMSEDSPAWKRECAKILSDAPGMSLSAFNDLHVSQNRHINYRLVDMNGSGTPELILQAISTEEGENILSFRYSWVGIYSFDGVEPILLFSNAYYQPGFAWDDSTRSLIIYSMDTFNCSAFYYALTMENGAVEEDLIFEGQFDSLDGYKEYNAEHGYVSVPFAKNDDSSLLLNY